MHEKGFKLGGEWTVERLASRKNNQMSSKGFRATLAAHDPDFSLWAWCNFYIHACRRTKEISVNLITKIL